jgi:hypothetical protein
MCLAIFIASDCPLLVTSKAHNQNQMRVLALLPQRESIRTMFSKPYVYEITGDAGCACDFEYDPDWEGEPLLVEENATSRAYLAQLSAYLSNMIDIGGPVELYAGYCDELELSPTFHGTITPEQLSLCRFNEQERKLYTVSRSPAAPVNQDRQDTRT